MMPGAVAHEPCRPWWCANTEDALNTTSSVPGAVLHSGGGYSFGGDIVFDAARPDPAWPENGPGAARLNITVQRVDLPGQPVGDNTLLLDLDGKSFAVLIPDEAGEVVMALVRHVAIALGANWDQADAAADATCKAIWRAVARSPQQTLVAA